MATKNIKFRVVVNNELYTALINYKTKIKKPKNGFGASHKAYS